MEAPNQPCERFLVHAPLPVGGIAVALTCGTLSLLRLPVDVPLLGLAFCGTTLIYLVDRVLGRSPEDHVNQPGRLNWARHYQGWIRAQVGFLCTGVVLSFPLLQWNTLGAAALLGGIGGVHLWSGLSGSGGAVMARLFKPLAVAGTWAVGAVVLPVIESGGSLSVPVLGLVIYRLLFILPNVLLCDWGDRAGDVAAGLQPWTEEATARGVRWGASGLLLLAVAGAAGATTVHPQPVLLGVDAIGPLLMLGAVWTADPGRAGHRLVLDLLVGWPVVTALVAWGIG